MKTITLDHIVRNTLMDMQYPMHYYVRFLHYGIQCLEEINYDIPLGSTGAVGANSTDATSSNVKSVELDVTSYKRAIIPSDCVDVVEVMAKYGEHLLPLRKDPQLNLIQNVDAQGTKIAHPDATLGDSDLEFLYAHTSHYGAVNEFGEHVGRQYGLSTGQSQSYNVDIHQGEIVFNNNVDVTKVTLVYITNGVTVSNANVVHPYAQDTIKKYIIYQKFYHTNSAFNKVGLAKQDFINAKRKLKSRLNALTYADIIASFRQGIHGSIKN
tara:strand:- start:964 stop:1767 length:804 start_codon:yes stop_codon:yes gene_type:complete